MTEINNAQKSALILVIDGLSPRFLGCYGNTWVETPNSNELAAQSQIFENAIADSLDISNSLQRFFSPRGAPECAAYSGQPNVIAELQRNGIETCLITDDPEASGAERLINAFDKTSIIQWQANSDSPATAIDETHLAACFAHSMQIIPQLVSPFVCVIYFSSLIKYWDAPYAARLRFVEEDDPEPPDFVTPAQATIDPSELDPDYLLGVSRAYAAQVQLLDECLGVLLEDLRENGMRDNMLIALTAPRGYPLGEHLTVGLKSPIAYSEATHVPLIVQVTDSQFESARHRTLVQPSQLMPTLYDWFEVEATDDDDRQTSLWPWLNSDAEDESRFVYMIDGPLRACWTAAWFFVESDQTVQLYVKPDDRWEVNPIGDRCESIVNQMRVLLDECAARIEVGQSTSTIPLADELIHGFA